MNENLNLVEILKDCPKGTKLYSTLFGEVKLNTIIIKNVYSIEFEAENGELYRVASDGRYLCKFNGECILFPSKDQRDWSKFKPKKTKFNPQTLKPFDKVLARDYFHDEWMCTFFSHIRENSDSPYVGVNLDWRCCIPYNDGTKHLVGTTEEAPEFYRYWED